MVIHREQPINMYSDNNMTWHIASKHVLNEITKDIKVVHHFVKAKDQSKKIKIPYLSNKNILKDWEKKTFEAIIYKLNFINLYDFNLK